MYIDKKPIQFNTIIQNIRIEQNYDLRDIFNNALSYQYNESERPIIFKENDIKRFMVNSIRHNYSNYEDGLKQIHRLKMHEDIYFRYKNIVLNKISEMYPFLYDECKSQKHDVYMVDIIKPVN